MKRTQTYTAILLLGLLSFSCSNFSSWNEIPGNPIILSSPKSLPWPSQGQWPMYKENIIDACATSKSLWGLLGSDQGKLWVMKYTDGTVVRWEIPVRDLEKSRRVAYLKGMSRMACIDDNNIWINTITGLVYQYNGQQWLPQNVHADKMYADNQGQLYIGVVYDYESWELGRGIYSYRNNSFALLKSGQFYAAQLDNPNDLWLVEREPYTDLQMAWHSSDGKTWSDANSGIPVDSIIESFSTNKPGERRAITSGPNELFSIYLWQIKQWILDNSLTLNSDRFYAISDEKGSWWFSKRDEYAIYRYDAVSKKLSVEPFHCADSIDKIIVFNSEPKYTLCDWMIFERRPDHWYSLANEFKFPLRWNDLTAISDKDIWMVADQSVTAHYDGTKWIFVGNESGGNTDLNKVWARSNKEIYAVGNHGTLLVNTGNSLWREVDHPLKSSAEYFTAIAGDKEQIIIGSLTNKVLLKQNNLWEITRLPIDDIGTKKICVLPSGQIWLMRYSRDLWTYQDQQWVKLPLESGLEDQIQDISCLPNGELAVLMDFELKKYKYNNWRTFSLNGLKVEKGLLIQNEGRLGILSSTITTSENGVDSITQAAHIWYQDITNQWHSYNLDSAYDFLISNKQYILGSKASISAGKVNYSNTYLWQWP